MPALPALEPCPFCSYLRGDTACVFVSRGDTVSVFLNPRQYERGALLVIPNAHVTSLLDTPEDDFIEVQMEARRWAQRLAERLGATGINVYQNAGSAAGQTVPHYHVHVVPRYVGSDPVRRFHESDYAPVPIALLEQLAVALRD